MNLRIKLTAIIFVMIAVVIAVLSVITLSRAGNLQTKTTFQYATEMAKSGSIEIQRRIEVYADYGHIISQIFSAYENSAENVRRERHDEILYDTIQQNETIIRSPSALMAVPATPPLTLQVTVYAGMTVPLTAAVNIWVPPFVTVAVTGFTATAVMPIKAGELEVGYLHPAGTSASIMAITPYTGDSLTFMENSFCW